jgi:hypothetical protein
MRLYRASLLSLITVMDENVGSTPINRLSQATIHSSSPDRKTRSGKADASQPIINN